MKKSTKKTKRKITAKEIIKYGACQHHRVSYRKMEELVAMAVKRSKKDAKVIADLTYRIRQDNWFTEGSPGYGKVLINDIKLKQIRINHLEKKVQDYEEANKEFVEQNEELRERLYGKSYLALKRYAFGRDKKKDH